MTGYHIRLGYISGYSFSGNQQEAWTILTKAVETLSNDTKALIQEVCRLHPRLTPTEVLPFAEAYGSGDTTVKIIQTEDGREVMLLASGDGRDRELKECSRRAFCRLLTEKMHSLGIEICVVVS